MLFWTLVFITGVLGGVADVVLNKWGTARELSLRPWIDAAVLIVVFATIFGYAMRQGRLTGYPLSAAVLLVLVVNIGTVVMFDYWMNGVVFTWRQGLGFAFGILAFICWEYK